MPSVVQLLREQMVRVSRKELAIVAKKWRRNNAIGKKQVSGLKQRIRALEMAVFALARRIESRPVTTGAPRKAGSVDASGWRPTGRQVRSLRRRLGVSQEGLSRLLKVTAQSVYLWERKGGRLGLRDHTLQALSEARKLSRREAKQILASTPPAEPVPRRKKRG
jgi:hypothetical protein